MTECCQTRSHCTWSECGRFKLPTSDQNETRRPLRDLGMGIERSYHRRQHAEVPVADHPDQKDNGDSK
jgi:hypothetical protein